MKKKVVVEILGHKACIESVRGHAADKPWWPEDVILVRLYFEKAVGSLLSFGINLPVREYTKDEFLAAVHNEGEHTLMVAMEGAQLKRDLMEGKEQKQMELDKIAWGIKALIGL